MYKKKREEIIVKSRLLGCTILYQTTSYVKETRAP